MPRPTERADTKYTYADYLTWPDDERWEIIDGVAYAMSPAPTYRHQAISRNLGFLIHAFLKDQSCEMLLAPLDVRLPSPIHLVDNPKEQYTVVQPDLIVVCDKEKLNDRGCYGAPDLLVEILSPSTTHKDLKIKYELYQRHGVKEYWIVYPEEGVIEIHIFDQAMGKYAPALEYKNQDKIECRLLSGLTIPLSEVFDSREQA